MSRSGGCLCGGVKFKISSDISESGACHCGMCRKFSGGVYVASQVPPDGLTFTEDGSLSIYTSSPWAERGFCKRCGSSIFYRVTAPGDHSGVWHVAMGALDNTDGIKMTGEIYTDKKPDGYTFAGDLHGMTEAEVMKMFGMG